MVLDAPGMISSQILFICLAITAATSYPYEEDRLLNVPSFGFAGQYGQIQPRPITFNKHFHFYTAPEEIDTLDDEELIPHELLMKNVRVVVIKSPENRKATAAIARLAKTLADEKTAIYVLNKEPDLREITAQIDVLKEKKAQGPEVHFIKYKTPEEAELAAINIQSQYESLEGPSEINKVETAPSQSYVGSLNGGAIGVSSESPIQLTTSLPFAERPLYVRASTIAPPVERVVSILPNPQAVPTSIPSSLDLNNLLLSTTLAPSDELNIPTPNDFYLPQVSGLRSKKRQTEPINEKVEENTK